MTPAEVKGLEIAEYLAMLKVMQDRATENKRAARQAAKRGR